MLVFGDGGGISLVLVPTSFGRVYQNKDFYLTDARAPHVENGKVTIYCPDAIDLDSFYNKQIHPADRIKMRRAFENVIAHGVFDFAQRECSACRDALSPSAARASARITPRTLLSAIRIWSAVDQPERSVRDKRFFPWVS